MLLLCFVRFVAQMCHFPFLCELGSPAGFSPSSPLTATLQSPKDLPPCIRRVEGRKGIIVNDGDCCACRKMGY